MIPDKRLGRITMAALIIGLSACDSNTTPSPAIQTYAANTIPASPALAAIYQRSCQACHARGTSDAPLTGHGAAWQQRLDKGMDTLVNNVVAGIGGMPPYGLCMDCNTEEFRQLIRFMAIPADAGE
ncbi:c-type cytochrome [Marinobacter sp. VGCF2001]|uniref:c-type cytochrome n=1 Tax=Marinobacter sp. VGCF2001 TaxID=3417189 RepID=UPI003CEDEF3C